MWTVFLKLLVWSSGGTLAQLLALLTYNTMVAHLDPGLRFFCVEFPCSSCECVLPQSKIMTFKLIGHSKPTLSNECVYEHGLSL